MKRLVRILLAGALVLSLACPAFAAGIGEHEGWALSTDIVAKIDGHPLRSFNILGHTAVVAEDLRDHGFWAIWDPWGRKLTVERAVDDRNQVVTPTSWPDYTPEAMSKPIGSKVREVLSTDIRVTMAGEDVESFNIGGETLVWLSDLTKFGRVSFDGENRVANLTLGDPRALAVAELVENAEGWDRESGEGGGAAYALYPNEADTETLFVGNYSGSPHGEFCKMVYVRANGTRVDIGALLPQHGFGAWYYLSPRDMEMDGELLRFITPVREEKDGQTVELGDCLCVVNVRNGGLQERQPLNAPMERWSGVAASFGTEDFGENLIVTVTRKDADVVTQGVEYPDDGLSVQLYPGSLTVAHYAPSGEVRRRAYHDAYDALYALRLPSLPDGDELVNTPEQRAEVSKYFRVTLNGQPVPGTLWWSQGNGHRDLCFDFDGPVALADGDVLELWGGMPRGELESKEV